MATKEKVQEIIAKMSNESTIEDIQYTFICNNWKSSTADNIILYVLQCIVDDN